MSDEAKQFRDMANQILSPVNSKGAALFRFAADAIDENATLQSELAQVRDQLKAELEHRAYMEARYVPLSQLEEAQAELKTEREYSESLAKDICKMEDVLGFAQDQHDKNGVFVPTIGPWLERVRDLIAAEGELGDLKVEYQRKIQQWWWNEPVGTIRMDMEAFMRERSIPLEKPKQ